MTPWIVAQRGALAGAIGPDQRHDLAIGDRERDAFEGMDIAVIGVNVFEFQHGGWLFTDAAFAQVSFDDQWIFLHIGRQTLGDLFAVIEHGDAV